jgi:hypothetical protein
MKPKPPLTPIKGERPSVKPRRRTDRFVRLVFVPDATGAGAWVLGAEDLLFRRLARAVEVTVPEDALGSLADD